MATKGKDKSDKDEAYWLEQWKASEEVLRRRAAATRRAWPGWVKEQTGRARYSAWLTIPCSASDYGMRPLVAGTPYWASPFIWVESPSSSGNPVAGAENHLLVRVFNLGTATAAPTKVDFYWSDPSVGLGAADAHFVGTEMVEVQPMSSLVVRCATPWIPTYLNDGHECTFIQCDNHVLDPLLQPFAPWADRHVGQRNLHVLPPVPQSFMLWAPNGIDGVRTQLRGLALRGTLRTLSTRQAGRTPAQLFGEAAARILAGLWPAQITARREKTAAQAQAAAAVSAVRIDCAEVIESVRIVATRARATGCPAAPDCCGDGKHGPGRDWCDQPAAGEAANAGEQLLQLDDAAGMAQQIEVRLRAVPLRANEFIVLNLTCVAAGKVRGGYVLVLVHPDWLKETLTHHPEDDAMQNNGTDKRDDLQQLVVEQYPQARLTLEIARALQKHLPLTSVDQLEKAAEYAAVGGQFFAKGMVDKMALKELLPIRDAADLVRKIAGVLVVAANQDAHGGAVRDTVANAAAGVLSSGCAQQRPSIPTHHFSGGSVFGSEASKGA
jgi:hypothetical protein